MLYIFDALNTLDEEYLERCLPLLSDERRNKVLACESIDEQIRLASSYLLLNFALRENFGITKLVEFTYGKHGKPYLRDHPGIFFSLSHCKNAVACLIALLEVGLCVHDVEPVILPVAQKVLTVKEYTDFIENPISAELNYSINYAQKMSIIKQKGLPLSSIYNGFADDTTEPHLFCCIAGQYCGCLAGISNSPTKQVVSHGISEDNAIWFDCEVTHEG